MTTKATTMPSNVKIGVAAGVVGVLATTAAFLMADKKMRTKVYKMVNEYVEQGSGKIEELKKSLTEIKEGAEVDARKTIAKTKVVIKKKADGILDDGQANKTAPKGA